MMDTEKLADESFLVNLVLTDDQNYLLKIHHGVLLYYPGQQSDEAAFTITTRRAGVLAIAAKNTDLIAKLVTVEGDEALYRKLCDSMVKLSLYFNIIEP